MAKVIESLLLRIGLDAAPAKKGMSSLNEAAQETDQTFNNLAAKWANVIKGLVSTVIAPVAGAFAIGKVINSYMSDITQVATMTGAYSTKLEEWRIKRAMLQRVTKEDIELYKKGREALVNYRIAFADLSANLMRSFMPVMKLLIDALNKITAWMQRNSDNIVRFIKVAAGVITTLFIPALLKMAAAFMANPLTWIIATLGVLVLVIDDLITYMQGGKTALDGFWSIFGTGEELTKAVTSAFNTFLKVLEIIGKPLAVVAASFAAFKIGSIAVMGLVSAFQKLRAVMLLLAANPLIIMFTALVSLIVWVADAFNRAGGDWSKVFDIMNEDVKDFLGLFGETGQAIIAFLESFDNVFGVIRKTLEGLISLLYNGIRFFLSFFTGESEEAQEKFKQGFLNAFKTLLSAIPALFSAVLDLALKTLGGLYDLVLNLLSALLSPIKKIFERLFAGIGDNLKNFANLITDIVDLLWVLLTTLAKDFIKSFVDLATNIADAFIQAHTIVTNFVNSVVEALFNIPETIKNALAQGWNYITGFFSQVLDLFMQIPQKIAEAFDFSKMFDGLSDKLKGAAGGLLSGFKNLFSSDEDEKDTTEKDNRKEQRQLPEQRENTGSFFDAMQTYSQEVQSAPSVINAQSQAQAQSVTNNVNNRTNNAQKNNTTNIIINTRDNPKDIARAVQKATTDDSSNVNYVNTSEGAVWGI